MTLLLICSSNPDFTRIAVNIAKKIFIEEKNTLKFVL